MFLGMDVDSTRTFAERMHAEGRRLSEEISALDQVLQRSVAFWSGPDAEGFRSSWSQQHRAHALACVDRLNDLASAVHEHVEEQEAASAPGDAVGAAVGAGAGATGESTGGPDATTRSAIPRGPLDDSGPLVDEDVAAAWNDMNDWQKRKVAQEIVDSEFEKYGMEPVTLQVEDKDEFSGSWNESEKKLTITDAWLDDPSSTAVFAHEVRHAAQSEFVREVEPTGFLWWRDDKAAEYARLEEEHGITRDDIAAFRENMPEYGGDYVSPPEQLSPDATRAEQKAYAQERYEYEYQPLEHDARTVGDGFSRSLDVEDLRRYQDRAGVEQAEPTGS